MANALNIRLINEVTEIAQGDNSSTIVVELLDNNSLIIPTLNGESALINLIDNMGEIKYQFETFVFDSRVEFNIDEVIPSGLYHVEIHVSVKDHAYVFPSNVNYRLRVNKSSNNYYSTVVSIDGIEAVTNAVYQKINADNPDLLDHTSNKNNPHDVTKDQIGLDKVDNIKQAPKSDFDDHVDDSEKHITKSDRDKWDGKVDQESGKGLSTNDFTDSDKSKLSGIEDGAQKNKVTSVNGNTGNVDIGKDDVGLSNVENYGIASKSEAESGNSDSKYMTPKRTKEAIDALATGGGGGGGSADEDITHLLRALTIGSETTVEMDTDHTRAVKSGNIIFITVRFVLLRNVPGGRGFIRIDELGEDLLDSYHVGVDMNDASLVAFNIDSSGTISNFSADGLSEGDTVDLSITAVISGGD